MAQLNKAQHKNLMKALRLANATTGEEREAHMNKIQKMILKYGLVVPDDHLMSESERHKDYKESIAYSAKQHGLVRIPFYKRAWKAIRRFFVKYF